MLELTVAAVVAAVVLPVVDAARNLPPHPADPFASPSTDPYNALRYIASNTLTGVAFALYICAAFVMSYFMWRRGARYMAAMVIGAYTFSIGLALRFGLHVQPESKGIYIAEYLLVVLSPCAFIAAVYVLLGRLARHLNAGHFLFIKPHLITRIFVSSDVVTFLIQAAGGSISISGSTSNDEKKSHTGSRIFVAGLALQLASFFLFTSLFIVFLLRVRRQAPHIWSPEPRPVWWRHWRTLTVAMGLSCIGILIRSAYRTVELSQGFQGHLAVKEGFFYGLDTFPLLLAIGVYVPFWPGQFINDETAGAFAEKEVESLEAGERKEAAGERDEAAGEREEAAGERETTGHNEAARHSEDRKQ